MTDKDWMKGRQAMDRHENKKRIRLPLHTWLALYLVIVSVAFVASAVFNNKAKLVAMLAVAPVIAIYVFLEMRNRDIRWSRYNLLVAALAALFLILTIIRGVYTVYAGCNLTLCLAAFVIGSAPASLTREEIHRETRLVAMATVFAFLPLVILALVSVFTARPIYLLDPERPLGIQTVGQVGDRLFLGIHPNYVASICVQCILLAVYLFGNARSRVMKAALAAAMLIYFLAIVHTQSRSGSIVLGIGVGALCFRWSWRRFAQNRVAALTVGFLLAAASVVMCLLLIGWVYQWDVRLALRLNPWIESEHAAASRIATEGMSLTQNGRGLLWKGVLRYLRANPLTLLIGLGAQHVFRFIAPFTGTDYWYGYLHNNFFEIVVRGGLPMLGLVVAMLLGLVRPCVRQLLGPDSEGERWSCIRPILVGVMLAVCVSEAMLFVYASFSNILFFILCGQLTLLEEEHQRD